VPTCFRQVGTTFLIYSFPIFSTTDLFKS